MGSMTIHIYVNTGSSSVNQLFQRKLSLESTLKAFSIHRRRDDVPFLGVTLEANLW